MNAWPAWVAVCNFAVTQAAMAGPQRFECPQQLAATALRVDSPKGGWTSFVSSPLYLSGAAPADGPPERLGILRGEAGRTTPTSWTRTYSLEGPYPEGKWLRCDYGGFGEVSLARRLPDQIRACTVTGRKGDHAGENRLQISCQ